MSVLHHVTDDAESVQSAQTSVEGEVHAQLLPGQFARPGGGAVVEGRTQERGVFGNVSLHPNTRAFRNASLL